MYPNVGIGGEEEEGREAAERQWLDNHQPEAGEGPKS